MSNLNKEKKKVEDDELEDGESDKMKKKSKDKDSDDNEDEVKESAIANATDNLVENVTKSLEDIDFTIIKEDLSKAFEKEDLSEEFISEATTLFEAAVNSRILEIKETVLDESAKIIQASIETYITESDNTLSNYLDTIVENWMEENKLAVESGVAAEISESFLSGMKTLFEDHYIDVPESKIDVLEEFQKEIDELKETVQKLTDDNITLKEENSKAKSDSLVEEIATGLTDLDVEKLKSLVEGIEYSNEEDFKKKVSLIKEKHFSEVNEENQNLNEEIEAKEENPTSVIHQYSKYITTGTR